MKLVDVEAPLMVLFRPRHPLPHASLLRIMLASLPMVRSLPREVAPLTARVPDTVVLLSPRGPLKVANPPTVRFPCRLVAPLALSELACTGPDMLPVLVRLLHCTPLASRAPFTLTVEENVAVPLAVRLLAWMGPLIAPMLVRPATVVDPDTCRDPLSVAAPLTARVLACTGPLMAPVAATVPAKVAAPLAEKVPATVSCWAGAVAPVPTPTLPELQVVRDVRPYSPRLA